jgi:hypothetical protein
MTTQKRKTIVTVAMICLLVTAFVGTAAAHGVMNEKQRIRKTNFDDKGNPDVIPETGEDFTFEDPFDIIEQTAHKFFMFHPMFGFPMMVVDYYRPNLAIAVASVLRGTDDYDVFAYHKSDTTPQLMSAYPMTAYCRVYQGFQPTVALAGPLDTVNVDGELVFGAPTGLPQNIVDALPEGYGVKVVNYQGDPKARTSYYNHHTENEWYLPAGIWDPECMEGLNDIDATNAARVAAGLEPCHTDNAINETIAIPGDYYYIVYHGQTPADDGEKFMWDYTLVTGTVDDYTSYDWSRVFGRDEEMNHGAQISNVCKLPVTK